MTAKEIRTICTTQQWNESMLNCLEVIRTLNYWYRYASQARSQQLFFFSIAFEFFPAQDTVFSSTRLFPTGVLYTNISNVYYETLHPSGRVHLRC